MDALLIHPENKEQLRAVKAFLKAMKIPFEEKKEDFFYPEYVIDGVKESLKQANNGNLIQYTGIENMLNAK
ncbi:hypothetical protein GCM10023231_40280 [Olivibacter ginsenosidimutans]|uniref:Uncharacterized protein n=1 Tax=Olivibacter ginsenosidimutans TaxID=1176537 RepID=A0ABP9CAR7_9SPHI